MVRLDVFIVVGFFGFVFLFLSLILGFQEVKVVKFTMVWNVVF